MTTKPIIEVKDLKKSFGTLQVLKGINTEVQRGEVVVVIGPSGSGKSTFLRCLNLLETPTAGSIYVDGAEITDPKCDINLHRQKMGMVFQHFNLFNNMTILRNMTLAPMTLLKKSKEDAEAQALKNTLPALANEFIVLLKETSVACYVAVNDLTKGGEIIRSQTYIQAMPLLIVAALYLIMVVFFSHLVSKLERRLRSSDH